MDTLSDDVRSFENHPTPQNLPEFVPYACFQLECCFRVKIYIHVQEEYHGMDEKPKKARRSVAPQVLPTPMLTSTVDEEDSDHMNPDKVCNALEIVITAIMDIHGNLVELDFRRCVEIPRVLIKVIALCIPFQNHFHKLTVRWRPLTNAGLYEFSKFLFQSHLSEICLDDSPVSGRNYEVLLERPSNLQFLSLARCKLDDEDCAKIFSLLEYQRPASKTLNALNLMSNIIGDKGASVIGQILRANRSLQYLNLSGNRITDVGAISIFKSLMDFRMTSKEVIEKKTRHFAFLKQWNEMFARCVKELKNEKSHDEVRTVARRRATMRAQRKGSLHSALSATNTKAQAMTNERIGAFIDPFSNDQTKLYNNEIYCIGNLALCYLNLSYNNIEFAGLSSLYDVLIRQSLLGRRVAPGLLRVNIDGNNLPIDCKELSLIEEMLERAQMARGKQHSATKRHTEKVKRKHSHNTSGRASVF